MSMELTPENLAEISAAIEEISAIAATVRQIEVAGHTVLLDRRRYDEASSMRYLVVGITNGAVKQPVMRERS